VDSGYWYWSKGIKFDIGNDNKVSEIYVFNKSYQAPARSKALLQNKQELKNREILKRQF